jgi:hypothetical protein
VDFRDIPIRVDPKLPSGAALMRSGDEQVLLAFADWQNGVTPAFAEDCASLMESMPYVIRYTEATEPVACECCGTSVVAVPEAFVVDGASARTWTRAIWEAETGRKHTLRRCNWKRDQAFSSKSSM